MPSRPPAYRGADRRRSGGRQRPSGALAVAAIAVLAVAAGVALLGAGDAVLAPDQAGHLRDFLRTTALVLALGAAALCFVRWRVAGEAAVAWTGAAVLVLGLFHIGVARVAAPILGAEGTDAAVAAGAGSFVVALAALVAAAAWPEIDAGLRVRAVVAGLVVACVVVAVAFAQIPSVAEAVFFGNPRVGTHRRGLGAAGTLAVVSACALGLAHVWLALRGRWVLGWTGLMALAVTLAALARSQAAGSGDWWALGSELLHAVAIACVVAGVGGRLLGDFLAQRGTLFETQVAVEAERGRGRALGDLERRHSHDVRNALMAVQGAASTLQQFHDKLGPEDRERLRGILRSGVAELQELVEDRPNAVRPFPLAEVVDPVAKELADDGVPVEADVDGTLQVVAGRADTREAVRQVCAAAVRSAAGPIAVAGQKAGDWVALRVSFPVASDAGDVVGGLSVPVASRLVEAHGGELDVQRSDGTLAFVLRLPAFNS